MTITTSKDGILSVQLNKNGKLLLQKKKIPYFPPYRNNQTCLQGRLLSQYIVNSKTIFLNIVIWATWVPDKWLWASMLVAERGEFCIFMTTATPMTSLFTLFFSLPTPFLFLFPSFNSLSYCLCSRTLRGTLRISWYCQWPLSLKR